ncbi:MAG: hypothetical protein IJM23_02375 [Lachnospiraceae bacterium]|nr:hypothetical protein [Lachnospiraceae bacterium]
MGDQFRLGRHYLFIKNGAVLRLDSITDIVNHKWAKKEGVEASYKFFVLEIIEIAMYGIGVLCAIVVSIITIVRW